jgi:hypothetical protein
VELRHHRRTLVDVTEDDRELLAVAVDELGRMPVRLLRAKLELTSRNHIKGTVDTKGLRHLRILVDGDEKSRSSLTDGTQEVDVRVTGRGPHEVELRGEGGDGALLASHRETLGGV